MPRITQLETVRRILATYPTGKEFTWETVMDSWRARRQPNKSKLTSNHPHKSVLGKYIGLTNLAERVGTLPSSSTIIWRRN